MAVADVPSLVAETKIEELFDRQRTNAPNVARSTARERKAKLVALERLLIARRPEIRKAMWEDFQKPDAEVDLSEVFTVAKEARHAARHVRRWMKPQRVPTPLALFGAHSEIRHEPKGVVLIIAPWNFPFNLSLGPLVGAIAAGNCAILKPSELAPHSAACMKNLLAELFPENEVAVVEGDAEVAQRLLRLRFDHIFFTGSTRIGREVMKAAAANLVPVTLELGGKSPVIVDETADIPRAAKSIAWGKSLNAGQTCIAPDYVLVQRRVKAAFVGAFQKGFSELHGDTAVLKESASYCRLVSVSHAERLERLLHDAQKSGAMTPGGAVVDTDERYLAPTIVENADPDSHLMQQEIFGPLLPLVEYDTIDDAIRHVREREKPLVLYAFTNSRANREKILSGTSSGAVVLNGTLAHFLQPNLPFGGVGESGTGRVHGFFGFETFSHKKAVLRQHSRFSTAQLLYPPYSKLRRRIIEIAVRYL